MRIHLLTLVFLLIASCTHGKNLTFTDCGNHEVQFVDVDPCDSDPCVFSKKQEVHGITGVISAKSAAAATITMKIKVFGQEVSVPGLDPDVCKITQCPITAGKQFTIETKMKVPGFAPSVSMK